MFFYSYILISIHLYVDKGILYFDKHILVNNKICVILYIEIKREAQRLIIFVYSIRIQEVFMKQGTKFFLSVAGFIIVIPIPLVTGVSAVFAAAFGKRRHED
jgi:hypothetical protein